MALEIMFCRSSRPEVFCKKSVLGIFANSQENACARIIFFNKVAGLSQQLYKKETPAQVFSCEFCEISKNTFPYKTPTVAASGSAQIQILLIVYRSFVRICNDFSS